VPARRVAFCALLLAIVAVASLAGCSSVPERVEGRVVYHRDPAPSRAWSQPVVTVTTAPRRPSEVPVTPEDLGRLVTELDRIGFFGLGGVKTVPGEAPPGSIAVDTSARKFFVTLRDLRTDDDARCFSRAASRIVAATQSGPHYELPK
jgi:hypothetical protein